MVADARQQLKDQAAEIEHLGQKRAAKGEHNANQHVPKRSKVEFDNDRGGIREDTLRTGKKFTVCDRLWLQPLSLPMLHVIANSHNNNDAEMAMEELIDIPQDELAKPKEEAELIFTSIPEHLHPHIDKDWFREHVCASTKFLAFTLI